LHSLYRCRHRLVLGEGVGVGADNVLLRLSLPLLPALIGAGIGILVRVFVGVGARRRVEAVGHALTVSAPPDPVIPDLHGHIIPLFEVVRSTFPAKEVGEVLATALWDLG